MDKLIKFADKKNKISLSNLALFITGCQAAKDTGKEMVFINLLEPAGNSVTANCTEGVITIESDTSKEKKISFAAFADWLRGKPSDLVEPFLPKEILNLS